MLGCSASANRCNKLDPSNGFANSVDEAAAAADLTLSGAATIDTDAGTVTDSSGARTVLSSTITTGVPIGLFVMKVKSFTTGGNVTVVGSRALVVISAGAVTINHVLSLSARKQINGPGAILNDSACRGGDGLGTTKGGSGGAGGGFGSAGGRGGNGGIPTAQGGSAGGVSGTTELIPLRGGCPGGRDYTNDTSFTAGRAGGAIQIVSSSKISLGDGGFVAANGSGGNYVAIGASVCSAGTPCDHGNGAGSGGAILLEAPTVTVSALAGLVANGGGGGCDPDGYGAPGASSAVPAAGAACRQDSSKGGDGAAGTIAAQSGGAGTGTTPVGSGGGGGAGRIRVNTAAPFSPVGVVSGVTTMGSLGVR